MGCSSKKRAAIFIYLRFNIEKKCRFAVRNLFNRKDMKQIISGLIFLSAFFFMNASFLGAQNRDVVSLDGEWNFVVDPDTRGLRLGWGEKGLPPRGKRPAIVPHTFNTNEGYYLYWGAGWYDRKFQITQNQMKKTVHMRFEAVNHDAIIWINGKKAGEHFGSGYTPFTIDITPYIQPGENTVTVYTNNEPSKKSIPYMKSFDWSHDGGIIRSVNLFFTEPQAMRTIHVNGIPAGNGGRAEIAIPFFDFSKINVSKTWFKAVITEENQKTSNVVYKGKLKGTFSNGRFLSTINLKKVNRWHFDSPNLYRIDITMFEGKTAKDELHTVFGFRSIKIENNRYVLNGEPMRLMGMEWTVGEDMNHGLAQTDENLIKGLTLMKNANCVFARSHWQQSEKFFDWCDRNGILVMEEIPLWGWEPHLDDSLLPVAIQQLDEMIDAHYNHPSIIIWGLGNELSSHEEVNIKGLDAMEQHVRRLDDSRLVAYISNAVHWDVPGPKNILPDASPRYDMIMYNEYNTTWYGYNLDSIPVALDRIHGMYPEKPVTISEWGICEPKFKGGDERRAMEMAEQIKIYGSKDYVAGAIYFCLNDYRTHFGEDSTYHYPQRIHGICDVKLNPKPSYYVMKDISSPIIVKDVTVSGNDVSLLLVGNTGIPSYTVNNYYLLAGETRIEITQMKPGQELKIDFSTSAADAVIYRPTGFEVMRIELK